MNLSIKHASELELARFARDGADPLMLAGDTLDLATAQLAAMLERVRLPAQDMAAQPGGRSARRGTNASEAFAHLRAGAELVSSRRGAIGHGVVLDLGKSWHLLHFLLAGQAWGGPLPAATLLAGGREIGRDLGYGKARIVSIDETAAFASFLADQSVALMTARIDVPAMVKNDIYSVDEDGLGTRTEIEADVAEHLPRLTAHLVDAAARQQGLLMWMM